MRERQNMIDVAALRPDYMGFIFYPKSSRFAGDVLKPEWVREVNGLGIGTVGVFVNETVENIMNTVEKFGFSTVQLHGSEPPEVCARLQQMGLTVWKVFHLKSVESGVWSPLLPYVEVCDAFLFDTPSQAYGGTGEKFGWDILQDYPYQKPFILSGGIGPEDIDTVLQLRFPQLIGIDINSKFEIRPGLKNVDALSGFIHGLKHSGE